MKKLKHFFTLPLARRNKKHVTPHAQRKIEKLSHFSCGVCKKWWSVGDAPEKRRTWYCPWCGAKQACT
ncbi:MAG: hypothetical protein A3J08_01380 [Candidatus Lloydbacteria bacterium RIFCSPLOWO2_02_FULL_51_11]|uniref:Uncharacterized protein n=1 Tax=Candidatus Lloydbacteria bacterium RIFCSPLOWO2_02_FULL_51_11 TaxID=1798667 RepID=A0A1G2DPW3_9BACT|nr:MAG: hypothetical protein A3J08_01380 [Candidatus Lloydbacteria bacterium RIFCSPLOWO2_02_FULL_51_11]